MAFQDVRVVIEVNQPAPLVGLGTPFILATHTEAKKGVYYDLATVLAEFGEDSNTYKLTRNVFAQGQYRPDKVFIATYTADTTAAEVLAANLEEDFYFVVSDVTTETEQVALSTIIEENDFKIITHTVSAVTSAFTNFKRTALFYTAPTNIADGEYTHAAAVGAIGSRDVGSVTWKFKELVSITPIDNYNTARGLTAANINVYAPTSLGNVLREGVMANGDFIDNIHVIDFVKVNIERNVQNILNNAAKVPYDDTGIAQLITGVTDALELAGRQGGIATTDGGGYMYSVDALTRAETTAQDRASRIYKGLSFEFTLAGAIHRVDPIQGVVNF